MQSRGVLARKMSGNPCITSSALSRRLGETPVVCELGASLVLLRIPLRLPTKARLLESYGELLLLPPTMYSIFNCRP
jgi:hypothetical protein